MNNHTFAQQVILITGASSGIGAKLAEILAQKFSGISLVLAARNLEKLQVVAQECGQAKAKVLVIPTDMSDSTQVQALAKQAVDYFGRVDAIVNNAGYGQMGPIELIPLEAAKQQLDVNFYGALILTQALIPVMRQQGGGRIINISSFAGKMAFPGGGMYSCSKFALEALSDVLRMELKGFNIQVSVVEPGPVMTPFFDTAWHHVQKTIPKPEKTIYKPVFAKIKSLDQQLQLLGWSAEKTAQIIVRALCTDNPRPRYVAATGGEIFLFLMNKILPTWSTDAFWKRFYGMNEVETAWKKDK